MRVLANSQLMINKKVYITGHSRGGMLAQRATSETTQHAYSNQVKRLAYFNGPGIIFNYDDRWVSGDENKQLNKVKEQLQSISSKVSRHVVFNQKKKNDLTASLGSHITTNNFYPYIAKSESYDGELTADDMSNVKVVFSDLHSMYHFTNRLPLYKRGN